MLRLLLRTLCSSFVLLAGAGLTLVLAGPAVAGSAPDSSSTVVIGTGGRDVINMAGMDGNFRLWGLGGFNALLGGRGDNLLVGNGHCPPDHEDTTGYDNASQRWDDYCSTDAIPDAPGAILIGGEGVNTILGSGGPNLIVAGPDKPFQGYGNTIDGGPAGNLIISLHGSSLIYPGPGHNLVDTRGSGSDSVICQHGDTHTVVYADREDQVHNCSRVVFHAPGWPAAQLAKPSLTQAALSQATDLVHGETRARVHRRARHKRHRRARHKPHRSGRG